MREVILGLFALLLVYMIVATAWALRNGWSQALRYQLLRITGILRSSHSPGPILSGIFMYSAREFRHIVHKKTNNT